MADITVFSYPGGNDRKAALVFLLLASPVFAQNKLKDTAIAPGCGAASAKFEVTTEESQHPVTQPEAGKALVYFIEGDSAFGSGLTLSLGRGW